MYFWIWFLIIGLNDYPYVKKEKHKLKIFCSLQGSAGTGQKIKVMSHILLNEQIGNMAVITWLQGQKLLVTIRNNCKHIYSGNLLQIISLPKLHLENRIELGISYSGFLQTSHSLLAVPYISRQIHIILFDKQMVSTLNQFYFRILYNKFICKV